MKQSRAGFLIVSLIAHLLVGAFWLWRSHFSPSVITHSIPAQQPSSGVSNQLPEYIGLASPKEESHGRRASNQKPPSDQSSQTRLSSQSRQSTPQQKPHDHRELTEPERSQLPPSAELSIQVSDSSDPLGLSLSADDFSGGSAHTSCMMKIHQRIESQFQPNWELMSGENDAVASIEIALNQNGSLLTILRAPQLTSSQTALQTWVESQISGALSRPVPGCALPAALTIKTNFDFRITSLTQRPAADQPKIVQNQLNFHLVKQESSFLQAHSTIDERGFVVGARLEELFRSFFKPRPTQPNRLNWDLEHRRSVAASACEISLAEGACIEAAKIDEAFGRKQEALKFYRVACELGYEPGCLEQGRLLEESSRRISFLQ